MADAVAWIGQDGNLYYGSGTEGSGVQNLGQFTGNYEVTDGGIRSTNFDTALGQGAGFMPNVRIISDPLAGTSAPVGGGGSGKVFNQAGADNTQRAIDEIPGLLQAALAAEGQRYTNTVNDFNTQEATQRKTYGDSTVTNQKNYDANFMDSIRAGIKGLGGILNILRGTGAGGGSIEGTARDVVGGVTANDIRSGADTRDENQTALDTSLSSFLTDLKRKRDVNEDTFENNKRSIQRDSDTQLQDLFGKMAGFYGDVDNTAASNDWMARAGNLTPSIAANSRSQVSAYDTTPVNVKAPELTAFAGSSQPNYVTAPNGRVGSGIFTMTDPRRRREQAAPVGV